MKRQKHNQKNLYEIKTKCPKKITFKQPLLDEVKKEYFAQTFCLLAYRALIVSIEHFSFLPIQLSQIPIQIIIKKKKKN